MTYLKYLICLGITITFLSCKNDGIFEPVSRQPLGFTDSSNTNINSDTYQAVIDKYINNGIPGMLLLIHTPGEGLWLGRGGVSCIETKTTMEKSTLLFSASVGKTYCAVSILLLVESGQLNLDDKIQTYLPKYIYDKIPNGKKATIRHLLTMQSGIPDMDGDATHLFEQVNDIYTLKEYDALDFIYDKDADFEPGTKTEYSSTNYELLAKIIDIVTGEHHSKYYTEQIFNVLGLEQTFYKNEKGYPNISGLENVYIDRFGDGKIENFTKWEKHKVKYLTGSDGIIASMHDYFKFYQALFNTELLSGQSVEEMKTWMPWSEEPEEHYLKRYKGYGVGLFYVETPAGICYGHTGNSGGHGMMIYYFPDSGLTIAYAVNITTSLAGKWNNIFQRDIWNDLLNTIVL